MCFAKTNINCIASPRQGADPVHLAHPTRNSHTLSNSPTSLLFPGPGGSTTFNHRPFLLVDSPHTPNFKQSNSSNNPFNNINNNDASSTVLVSVDPITQTNCNQTNSSSSSDDEDGGDQDDESDSTESISTDESDNNQQSPVKQNTNSKHQVQKQHQSKTLLPHEVEKTNLFFQPSKSFNEQNSLTHDWPIGRPLPLPMWDEQPPEVVHFDSVLQYEGNSRGSKLNFLINCFLFHKFVL